MSATIETIAGRCGISTLAVRRILNSFPPGTDAAAIRAVLEAAEREGYRHDGRSYNLGVVYRDENTLGLEHPFFSGVLNAFKAEAESLGCDITFLGRNIAGERFSFLEHSRFRGLDGVCLVCGDFDAPEVLELVNSEIPCVAVDHLYDGIPCVLSDNENGIRMLVDYAVDLGHSDIAFIHGHNNSIVTRTRIGQFRQAMAAHGLPVSEASVVEGQYGAVALVRDLVMELLNRAERPTCILLPDDASYFGAQEAARREELRIPADISFMGYDGIELTQALRPRLTTIRQNSAEIGRQAAHRLVDLIEHPEAADRAPLYIPVELLKGDTVGWCDAW